MTLVRLLRVARQRLKSLTRPERLDGELDRELAFHLDALIAENVAEGMTPVAARQSARRALGNVSLLRDLCRDERHVSWWHDLRQDVSYGLRMLGRAPAFTAVSLVSLALGIGANSAVFGVMTAVLRDSLPLGHADRLVAIRSVPADRPTQAGGVSAFDYQAWKEHSTAFDAIELTLTGPRDLGTEENGMPAERTTGQAVTPCFFTTLGIDPLIGRTFTDEETRAGARVVILSYGLWQRRYGGASDILNKDIRLDAGTSTVIGVMGEDYSYRDPRVEFWTPMNLGPVRTPGAGRTFVAIARLKVGVTIAQAQQDVTALAAELAREYPAVNAGWNVRVISLRDELFGWTREPLLTLQAAVAMVLLIACANVAALLLARASVRRREIAMRVALGAGRARIIRQLLTESVLLSLGGGALGLVVTWIGLRGLTAMGPPFGSPAIAAVPLDVRILAVTGTISVATGMIFGLAPALAASRLTPAARLEGHDRTTGTKPGHTMRAALVTAQIALALILLIGFGLLTNSFLRLTGRDLNFDPSGLLMFEVRTSAPQRSLGQDRGFNYFEMLNTPSETIARVYERLRAIPGAESVAGISFPPVDSLILPIMDIQIDGRSPAQGSDQQPFRAAYFLITPNVFHTMKTSFVSGRDISEADTVSRPWVAIVNEAAARRFWPREDPIGRRLTIDVVPEERPREVIGVVRDIPTRHGQIESQPVIYASYLQQPSRYRGPFGVMFGQMTFLLRHSGDPLSLVPTVRKAVAEIEPRPISSIMTADERRSFGIERGRYGVFLVGVLASTAALLAAVGVYGLLAYSVNLRTREIGIRKALGAGPRAVVSFLVRHVLIVVALGLAIGYAGALALTRLIASQLWGITPTDPSTFITVSVLLVSVALLACIGPARRAIAVDPTIALRSE